MASPDIPAHARITHVSGLRECSGCLRLWSWKRAWEDELAARSAPDPPSPCCGASAPTLRETVVVVMELQIAGDRSESIGGLE